MESNRDTSKIKEQGSRNLTLSLFFLSFFLVPGSAICQTWNEFFKQNKTQISYLGEQVAALKLYTGYLKKGYEIGGSGINTIKDIKNGEFSLHSSFISSLTTVNPNIRSSSKIADILAYQLGISKSFSKIKGSPYLITADREYISRVKNNIQQECRKDLEELLLVITPGPIATQDDERIKRLDKVFEAMKDKSAFTQSFTNNVNSLVRQLEQDANDAHTIRKPYGIIR